MKVKEIDLSKYTYGRINLIKPGSTEFFAPDSDDLLFSRYGEEELAEGDSAICEDSGWLVITLAKKDEE